MVHNSTDENNNEFSGTFVIWLSVHLLLLISTLAGNVLTLCAITLSRKISGIVSNQFVFSLALSDLMVGLTIPYHFIFAVGNVLNSSKLTCILRFVLIVFACSSSIYNLLAIATDRYIAIVYPLRYYRYMSRNIANCIIIFGWCFTFVFATVLTYWNDWEEGIECSLNDVVPDDYATYVVTPMFISVWLVMLLIYTRIWREAAKHMKRLRHVVQYQSSQLFPNDCKSVQVVLLILGCFTICWLPYFITITCIRIMGELDDLILVYEITFTLAMANSCMNPLIYAWKNSNFRQAFWCMLHCKSPNTLSELPNYITNHTPTNDKNLKDSGTCFGIDNDISYSETEIEMHDKRMRQVDTNWDRESSVVTVSTGFHSLSR